MKIQIPKVPPSLNQYIRMHWTKRQKLHAEWMDILRVCASPPVNPLYKARLSITRYSSRSLDYDNLVGSYKIVTDCLTKLGFIIDDRYDVIGVPDFKWYKCKRIEERTLINIESIE